MKDREIIELFIGRDERAIKAAVEKYGYNVKKCIEKILDNEEDAKECENDTYLKAWCSIRDNRPCNLRAYLEKIACHEALGRKAYNEAQKRKGITLELDDELEDTRRTYEYGSLELRNIIADFLRNCSPDKRKIFMLRLYEGASYEEISNLTGYSVGQTCMMVSRMRKKLKEYLNDSGVYM